MESRIEAKPLFAATLRPHRALSRRGRNIVLAVFLILAIAPALSLARLGVLPMIGFIALGALGLWWALSASPGSGSLLEQVTLWPDRLEVKRTPPRGEPELLEFSPFDVRLIIDRDFEERVTAIRLRSQARDMEIGAFLDADDKASFSQAFGTALRKARG